VGGNPILPISAPRGAQGSDSADLKQVGEREPCNAAEPLRETRALEEEPELELELEEKDLRRTEGAHAHADRGGALQVGAGGSASRGTRELEAALARAIEERDAALQQSDQAFRALKEIRGGQLAKRAKKLGPSG
jgi:hypothetical protein